MAAQALAQAEPARAEMGRVAAKLFLAITDEWGLTDRERCILAGVSSRTTLNTWRRHIDRGELVRLAPDTLERLSYVAGIYKALQVLFASERAWREWVRRPNRDFGGQSALDRMLAGRVVDLADVRRYLDAWRGAPHG